MANRLEAAEQAPLYKKAKTESSGASSALQKSENRTQRSKLRSTRSEWLADPVLRTLESCERNGEHWVLLRTWADQDDVRAAPFDAVPLELGLLRA